MAAKFFAIDSGYRIYPIRGFAVTFHLLYDVAQREAVLIDTGLAGEISKLEKVLNEIDLPWTGIRAILLTHGHLDHTGNLATLKNLTRAPVWAHQLEQAHIDGTFPYRGLSRICGALEAIGRSKWAYQPVQIDHLLLNGMVLPYWGGIEVVHLPGHTEGHCGFFSRKFHLLFSGDLFASLKFSSHLPPVFLNSCPEKLTASLRAVEALSPRYIIPSHYSALDGELHRNRLFKLMHCRSSAPWTS